MRSFKKVLAVCVNWNGREVLEETLDSLAESSYPNLETVVVDCASDDDSAALVPATMRLVCLDSNPGYAAALNVAIQEVLGSGRAPPEYFLCLNNDLAFPRDTLWQLIDFAEQTGPGVFGPKVLLYGDMNRLDAAWGEVTWTHVLASFQGRHAPDSTRWNTVKRVGLILGCFVLIHRKVVEEVGPFDERFFMYHEEVDFLYRAGQRGFPVFYCPFALTYHRSGHSTAADPLRRVYWVRRNTVLFLRKHRPGFKPWCRFLATLLSSLLYNLLLFRWERSMTILRGSADGFRNG